MLISFGCTEVAVAVVVGIYHDGLDDDFRVYHDELQLMLARSGVGEIYLQPADIVKHLIATQHLPAVLPTAKQQVVVGWEGLQVL